MGGAVKATWPDIRFQSCGDPEPRLAVNENRYGRTTTTIRNLAEADFYLVVPFLQSWLAVGSNVFKLCGVHRSRSDHSRHCLESVLTGTKFDVLSDDYAVETAPGGSWVVLSNEMQVIAWAASK